MERWGLGDIARNGRCSFAQCIRQAGTTYARYLQLSPVRRVRLSATGQPSRHPDPNHVMQLNAAAVHNFK